MAPPAAPTLSLVGEPDVKAVKVTVGTKAGSVSLYLSRGGPSGSQAGVRGFYPVAVSGATTLIIRDFEAPIGVNLTYGAATVNAAGEVSPITNAGFMFADEGCTDTWLTDLVRVGNTQRIVMQSLDELTYEAPVGVHRVIGRRTPIVTSDVAWTPSFELAFVTANPDEQERARACLGNGVPVLLRTPPANGVGNMYFAVTEFAEQRVLKPAREDDRLFVVQGVQVDRPDPALFVPSPPSTYTDMKADFATYATLNTERSSYDAAYYNYAGTEAEDVVPWPPTDV